MARIRQWEPEEVDDEEIQEIFEYVRENQGSVPNHFKIEANFPELFKHVFNTQRALWEDGPLSIETMEQIAIAVSMANDCDYCTGAHCTILGNKGTDRKEIVAFQEGVKGGSLNEFEQTVIDFALQVNDDPHGVTEADIDELRADHDLSDKALLQIVQGVNAFAAANRVNIVFDTEYDHPWKRGSAED
ncbi:peroxidase-related enzyme [Natronorubrum sp. JWXQ-INN-674]|uniref:Peroxidase-related enzyme n=1 Tax=Natronorubrum halalkaliphilum TaxID=2691917 RepID=A0A6B0VJ32_9EURY|nr:peroxidase-related enzyme [Natronorubrum halalkaliphilum]MXV61558.1 peroxidase-related enzyme [Natronorubrum halalkaliphilum]